MANKKITLKDQTNTDELYPKTLTSAVFNESGVNIDTLLQELDDIIGDLSTLTTTDKSSLVNAINEISITTKTVLLTETSNVPTSDTEYSSDWNSYDFLIFCGCFYGNVMETIIIPKFYFTTTGSGRRVYVRINSDNIEFQCYQAGTNTIKLKSNNTSAQWVFRIFGIKIGN